MISCTQDRTIEKINTPEINSSLLKSNLTKSETEKKNIAKLVDSLISSDKVLEASILENIKESTSKYVSIGKIIKSSLTSKIPSGYDDYQIYMPSLEGRTMLYEGSVNSSDPNVYITYYVDGTDYNNMDVFDSSDGTFLYTTVVSDDYLDTHPVYVIDDSPVPNIIDKSVTSSPGYITDNVSYNDYKNKIVNIEIPEVRMNGKTWVKSFGFRSQKYKLYRSSIPISANGVPSASAAYMVSSFTLRRSEIRKKKWVTINATYSADINEMDTLHYLHIFSFRGKDWKSLSPGTTTFTSNINNGVGTINTVIELLTIGF